MSQCVTSYSRVLTCRHEPLTCIHLSIQSQSFALIHDQRRTTYFHNVHPIMLLVRISWFKSPRNSFFLLFSPLISLWKVTYCTWSLCLLPSQKKSSKVLHRNSSSIFICLGHKHPNYQSRPARQMLILP